MNVHEPPSNQVSATGASVEIESLDELVDGELVEDGPTSTTAEDGAVGVVEWTGRLVDAFRDANLIGKDETLRLVERAMRSGMGWRSPRTSRLRARPPM